MSIVLKTRRLVLRELADSDVPQLARFAGDWDVARMTARIPYPYSEALAREWLATLADDEFVRGVELQGTLVGAVGYIAGEDRSAEIGYWIGTPWWGQGLATEAARALVRYCFTTGGFRRLTCCHFVDNPASARVIEKLGFQPQEPPHMLSSQWSDARQADSETRSYELHRPKMALFWR